MKSELLAPAGNLNCLKVAVKSGADAVYLGLGDFNARNNLTNFSREELAEGVRFAHLFGVKVYLTLNILIKDEEIENVLDFVRFAIAARVDAFIIQDIGLAHLLKTTFPKIELHASTQMGVATLEGAKFLKEHGFSRVVLARETSLAEIKRIKDNLDIDIEYFVQGALCVGYSGNCYFSSLEENASGNRGKCKQLCRLPFEMDYCGERKQGYLLSTKDLCLLPALKQLADAGVTSFKIEGRARREAYVAGAVQIYRKAIDDCYKFTQESIDGLKKLFNRGDYVCGYLKGENMIYPQINSHIGVEIGKVISFKKGNRFNEIILTSRHNIKRGDVLQFVGKNVQSLSVYDVKETKENTYKITTTNVVDKNTIVRLLVDSAYEDELCKKERMIELDAQFIGKLNCKPVLKLKYKNIEIECEGGENCQEAKSQPLSEEECKNQIAKMGYIFKLKNFKFSSDNIFMRKAELNNLRRDALEKLQEKVIFENEKHLYEIQEIENNLLNNIKNNKKTTKNNKKIIIFNDINKIKLLDDKNYLVYSPEVYNKQDIIDLCKKANKIIYLYTPIYSGKKDIEFFNDLISQCSNLGVLANNYYALNLTTPEKTIIGSELNVFNNLSINFYKNLGYDKIILSKEILISTNNKNGLFVNNLQENLIYFKHCPIKEHIGGNCGGCKFKNGITYSFSGRKYLLKRIKINSCTFYLKSQNIFSKNIEGFGTVEEI